MTPTSSNELRRRHGGGVVSGASGSGDSRGGGSGGGSGGGNANGSRVGVEHDGHGGDNNGHGGTGGAGEHQQQQQQQPLPPLPTTTSTTSIGSSSTLADAAAIDRIFPKAAAIAVAAWLLLLTLVYTCTPSRYPRVYLSRQERDAAMAAFFIMLIATLLLLMPFVFVRPSLAPGRNGRKSNVSGIVVTALTVQFVSCATNGILAFLPNLVIIDPVTHAPVYLTRWCEWIALSGLMTFLSETIDLEKQQAAPDARPLLYHEHPLFKPILSGLVQSLSCVCGIIFPFCYGLVDWNIVMFISIITYLYIFPRVLLRKNNFDALRALRNQKSGNSAASGGLNSYTVAEMEEFERRRFGYYLMSTCSIVWTVLVVIYFLNMMAYRLLPPTHPIRLQTSLAMLCDTFFDVLAKALYMKLILDVHKSVFDEVGRAHRQLKELRQLMSVFWEDCSDVIVISVRNNCSNSSLALGNVTAPASLGLHDEYGNPCCMYTTMLSSAFPPWVLVEEEEEAGILHLSSSSSSSSSRNPNSLPNRKSACLTLEIRAPIKVKNKNNRESHDNDDHKPLSKPVVVAAYFVDSSFVPLGRQGDASDDGDIEPAIVCSQDVNSLLVQEAAKISNFVWDSLDNQNHTNSNNNNMSNTATAMHPIRKSNGEMCFCESKVSRHAGTASNDNDDMAAGGGGGYKSLVAVVRDVTERVRRFEAEQRAHAETLARQRDAQSVNRFTRHEVKNGLLAGIELCDNLRVLVEEKNQQFHEHDNDMNQAATAPATSVAAEYETESTEVASAASKVATTTATTTTTKDSFLKGVLKQVKDLDKALHDILDTVLTEATARDVIHEVYRPQLIPMNVEETLTGTAVGIGGTERFPLVVKGPTLPTIEMDTQLLCYIHRNAVSNACKYGKAGGIVQTIIGFDSEKNELELHIINEAGEGHDELLTMGESASHVVFEQGKRLSMHLEGSDKHLSFGDGAWIMRKCAKALNGTCLIHFEQTQTIVTFKCPATPTPIKPSSTMFREFEVPPGTWGIGLDDSKIQRKILGRILSHVGVDKSRLIVLGKTSADVELMGTKLLSLLEKEKESKFLILVDEILDYSSTGDKISGSCAMKEVLDQMTPEQECRVLALVRSANDAHHDITLYCERTHGFFPKSPTQRDRVRETLAPLWLSRFQPKSKDDDAASQKEGDSDLEVSASEVLESLKSAQERVDGMPKPLEQTSWSNIWSSLHSLRGDLMMVEDNDDIATAASLINELRGPDFPSEFQTKWDKIQAFIQQGAKNL